MVGLALHAAPTLTFVFGNGGHEDVERSVRRAILNGGHAFFPHFENQKIQGQAGGSTLASDGARKHKCDQEETEQQILEWAVAYATTKVPELILRVLGGLPGSLGKARNGLWSHPWPPRNSSNSPKMNPGGEEEPP